jgi:hypothetical protein
MSERDDGGQLLARLMGEAMGDSVPWGDLREEEREVLRGIEAALTSAAWRKALAAARIPTGFAMTMDQRYALDLILAEIERAAREAGVDLPAGDAGA